MASGFLALGLRRGDRVGVWGGNCYEWVVTLFAAAKAGLILVNINPSYLSEELLYCINKVSLKSIVFAESFKKTELVYSKVLKKINNQVTY